MYGSEADALADPWGSKDEGAMCQATRKLSPFVDVVGSDPHDDIDVVTSVVASSTIVVLNCIRFMGGSTFIYWLIASSAMMR
jgi:hypothetical protein